MPKIINFFTAFVAALADPGTLCAAVGTMLIAIGCSLIYLPLGYIVAGGLMILGGIFVDWRNK